MKFAGFLGMVCAVVLHAGFVLFGGLLFPKGEEGQGTLQEVDLLSEDDSAAKEDEPPEERETTATDELETEVEAPPDAAEMMRELELSAAAAAPELEAASLGAIEAALSGTAGGGGDFAEALSFSSGGRIGGTGKPGALDEGLESAFSLVEIDQQPRAIYKVAPVFPGEMRGKKLEGVVTVIFVVDASGKVVDPRAEKSSHPAFERPALDALRQWRFEPAIKGGQRVACKVRQSIRFQPS